MEVIENLLFFKGIHACKKTVVVYREQLVLFDEAIERRQSLIAKQRGFALREHSLSLYGSCDVCAALKKK